MTGTPHRTQRAAATSSTYTVTGAEGKEGLTRCTHTDYQLNQPREDLERFLRGVIRDHTIVVMGYGGWDDIFTRAVAKVVSEATDDHKLPVIL